MTAETFDWSGQESVLEYVRSFVKLPEHSWRATSTGLIRLDRPAELTSLKGMIEQAFHTRIHEWWVMKQPAGAPGALPHIHNNWDTYIYYPEWSDAHIMGEDFDIMPKPGLVVYLPVGTIHGVEDSYAEEGGEDRYSCVFLAYPKDYAFITGGEDTQGQEA